MFESVVKYFDAFLSLIPLSFVLGSIAGTVANGRGVTSDGALGRKALAAAATAVLAGLAF